MELLEKLELVEVNYENEGKKATLVFLDAKNEEVREVTFNRQKYDEKTSKFIDDKEKAAQVDKWCEDYFQTTFDMLSDCVGVTKDIYAYDTFCSLWETTQVAKFKEEDLGLIDSAPITEIIVDNVGIKIRLQYDGETYESKMAYSKWMESLNKWLPDPNKKKKRFEDFKEKFGISIDDKDELIGKEVMFEVKKAMGKHIYVEIKKTNTKKGKK